MKYMMNLGAIEAMDSEKFEVLVNYFNENGKWWNRNCIPVVDLTTGEIYANLIADNRSSDYDAPEIRMEIKSCIETNTSFYIHRHTYKISACVSQIPLNGHRFMDAGSVDIPCIKLYIEKFNTYLKNQLEKEVLKAKLERAQKEIDEIRKFLNN